jgi:hypothetical protein
VSKRDWTKWRVAFALALVGGFLVVGAVLVTRAATPPLPPPSSERLLPASVQYAGLVQPPAKVAAAAELRDADVVVGVVVGNRARAYAVAALTGPRTHVINDLIAGTPVTVTYCDRKYCARVFTGDGTEPLSVGTGGFDDGLILLLDGRRYRQDTGEEVDGPGTFPYRPMTFVRTTWKEWSQAHPDTDVVGE